MIAKFKKYYTYENVIKLLIGMSIFYAFQLSIVSYIVGSKGLFLAVLGILALVTIVFMVKRRQNLRGLLLMWIVFVILTLLNNYDLRYETPSIYAHFLLSFSIMLVLSGTDNWSKKIYNYILFMSMFHVFFTILCYLAPDFYLNYVVNLFPNSKEFIVELYNANCVSGLTGHYSTNGIYISIASLFSFSYLLRNKNAMSLVLFGSAIFALFLTGKRAHLLFALFSIAIMYLVSAKFKNKFKRLLIYGVSGGTTLIVLSNFIPALKTTINRLTEAASITELLNGRTYFWDACLDYFSNSPMVGIGWGGFKYNFYSRIGVYDSMNKFVEAHNVFLQVLCELGILGFVTFLYILIKTLIKTFHYYNLTNNNDKDFLCLSIGVQIFFILYCFSGNPLYDIQFLLVYFITVSYTYSLGGDTILNKANLSKVWKFIKTEIKK